MEVEGPDGALPSAKCSWLKKFPLSSSSYSPCPYVHPILLRVSVIKTFFDVNTIISIPISRPSESWEESLDCPKHFLIQGQC